MASRKRRESQKVTPGKATSDARKYKSDKVSIPPYRPSRKKAYNPARVTPSFDKLTPRSLSARTRAIQVLRDLRSDPSLTFSQAADNHGVSTRTIHRYVSSALRRDKSGRIKVKPSDRLNVTLQIPSTKPGESIPIKTKHNKERKVIGQWLATLKAAGDGDFSLIHAFPRGQMIGGVLLPTGAFQIQRLLEALEKADAKFEGPYKAFSARSA